MYFLLQITVSAQFEVQWGNKQQVATAVVVAVGSETEMRALCANGGPRKRKETSEPANKPKRQKIEKNKVIIIFYKFALFSFLL